ncbi:hypothetical protein F511_24364 [Dorcoceras hygrometricum]|uniref:CCHC-type domain-containing protein n=1 Tax=Dorcoceras hygrometricum TaxID=472368 RepID=A0A2Z7A232_9LAMI|nr:hypothetical protein F511_24364 [Dorcoceras hygrometricum]
MLLAGSKIVKSSFRPCVRCAGLNQNSRDSCCGNRCTELSVYCLLLCAYTHYITCISDLSRIQVVQGGRPAVQGAQSSQSAHQPQQQQQPQVAQHSDRQRFRPCGQQFKKKSGSGSSGSVSSSSSGSWAEFCGYCGGKHPSTQCVGVQGSCNICGQYGHFARVCPSAGSQQAAAPPQGRGG